MMKNLVISLLFGFPNLFFLQLIIAELLFSGALHKRDRFALRAWGSGAALLLVSIGIVYLGLISENWYATGLMPFILMFLLSVVFLWICFDEKLYSIFLCAASGYMTQHIAAQICQIVFYTPYEAVKASVWDASLDLLRLSLSNVPVYAVTYIAVWHFFAHRLKDSSRTENVKQALTTLSVVTLIVVLVMSSVRDIYASESFALMVITRIFSVFCCLILLYLRTNIIEKSAAGYENALLRTLGDIRERQYAESKETIELINIKAHDIRHQLGKMNFADAGEIREVVNFYDSAIKTGNEILDTLFTEKSIFCERHQITLSCMIDGECLAFMTVGDICSLFGNALENAIEAVMQIQEKEKRIISFRIREQMGMVVANIDNNYAGEIKLVDGLPQTSKKDDRYHGFGIKSIRRIAEKYDGEATITVDDMFHLSILIPIP